MAMILHCISRSCKITTFIHTFLSVNGSTARWTLEDLIWLLTELKLRDFCYSNQALKDCSNMRWLLTRTLQGLACMW